MATPTDPARSRPEVTRPDGSPTGAATGRGRPRDAGRRERVAAACAAHVLQHGLAEFSLRGMAAAVGSSPRMLLYDFGSGEELLLEVTHRARRHLADLARAQLQENPSPAGAVEHMWRWYTEDDRRPYARFAVQARQAFLTGRLPREREESPLADVFAAVGAPPADHVLVSATFFALLELHLAGDVDDAEQAMRRFLTVLRTR